MRILAGMLAAAAIAALTPAVASAEVMIGRADRSGAVTPDEMTRRLEQQAVDTQRQMPRAARAAQIDVAWPTSRAEYDGLDKFVVVLVSAVSQSRDELPLKRVYVRLGDRELTLHRLASWRSETREGSTLRAVLGPYREDAFYVAPAGALLQHGWLLCDFAERRTAFRLFELPLNPPDFVREDPDPNPA